MAIINLTLKGLIIGLINQRKEKSIPSNLLILGQCEYLKLENESLKETLETRSSKYEPITEFLGMKIVLVENESYLKIGRFPKVNGNGSK